MDCCVVIPYKDRFRPLVWTLRSLSKQRTKYQFEVLIVDDGSDVDPQPEVLETKDIGSHVRFIRQNNAGAAKARNTGWTNTNADIVIFLDCDQIVGPNFIQNHVSAFRRSPHQFMQLGLRRHLPPTAKIDLDNLGDIPGYKDERTEFFARTSYSLNNIEIAWHLGFSHNMSFRRADLQRIGGLNEDFTGWGFEDCELVYRFAQSGVPPILNPAVGAYHQAHTMGMSHKNFRSWLENLKKFKQLHPSVEVAAQDILITSTNPDKNPSLKWTRTLLQMEAMVRLSVGRPIQSKAKGQVRCETKAELLKLANSGDAETIVAHVPKDDIRLIVDAQLDPALKEVRMVFGK